MAMFSKILIANRGEIALRILRTCKRLGIQTVAVYSEADSSSPFVQMSDQAFCIGPPAPLDSYLRIDRIIHFARLSGAEAIHPGYGFLSENGDFAEATEAEDMAFIGPAPETIRAMASKSNAKDLMAAAGVATLPGFAPEDQSIQAFQQAALSIGYPVLLKAVAGGGGKGMRLVEDEESLETALESAKREARSAFGDDRFLVEKFLLRPRHLEVQIFGDGRGGVVHLFDRDCSVQRHHQKIIEEAPAPNLPATVRTRLLSAGVAAGQAVNYRNAGTVEFLYDGEQEVYFMEMNTRLQVEHPVSEEITGIDCVEWQLRIAAGDGLPLKQDEICAKGHALEARVYAEDPFNNFLPSTGTLTLLKLSDQARNDTGVREGQEISPYYDSMISKIITHAPERRDALFAMCEALKATHIAGVKTNTRLLHAICSDEDFVRAEISTRFIEEHSALLQASSDLTMASKIAATLWHFRALWYRDFGLSGWRMNSLARATAWIASADDVTRMTLSWHVADKTQLTGQQEIHASAAARKRNRRGGQESDFGCRVVALEDDGVAFRYQDKDYRALVAVNGEASVRVWFGIESTDLELVQVLSASPAQRAAQGSLTAALSGTIIQILGAVGDSVKAGDHLLVMEAMKMEHRILAPKSGVIRNFPFAVGQRVQAGDLLVEMEAT